MARNRNVERASQRARVDTVEGGGFGLSVAAPNGGAVVDPSAAAASQLMDALGVGKEMAAKNQARRQSQGETDSAAGDVDEELRARSEHYRSGVIRNQAESGFIHASREMAEQLDALDLASVEPDELPAFINRAIDQAAMDQYGGLEDRTEASVVAPLLKKFREAYVSKVVGEQKAVADAEQQSHIRNIAGAMATANTPFDHNAINERVTAVYGKSMKSQELSFQVIADIAIREGRPELLEQFPDKWANGAPTAKIIPEYAAAYRSALSQAQSNASAKATAASKAQTEADKESLRLAKLEAAHSILFENRDPAAALAKIMALPGADSEAVFAIQNAWRSSRDDKEERAANVDAVNDLWSRIYRKDADIGDVLEYYHLGALGNGPAAQEEAKNMYAAVNQMSNSGSGERSRVVSEHQQNLSERYNPNINGALGALDANRNMIRIEAMREYNSRVLERSEDPVTVWNEVATKYDEHLERIGSNFLPSGSVSTQSRVNGVHAAEAVRAFAAGKATAADLLSYGATPDRVEALFNAGRISGPEANAAFSAFISTQ